MGDFETKLVNIEEVGGENYQSSFGDILDDIENQASETKLVVDYIKLEIDNIEGKVNDLYSKY
ncbi:MAG: hypothetical protein PHN31_05490 [Candidatus Gracilibacteria bacterium]|nr:hypothetical protein [Candidatus Gracilibacteria bacterium]